MMAKDGFSLTPTPNPSPQGGGGPLGVRHLRPLPPCGGGTGRGVNPEYAAAGAIPTQHARGAHDR